MTRSISFLIEGDLDTRITITETLDGALLFEIELVDGGTIGDLGALFFDLADPADGSALDLSTLSTAATGAHDDVTNFVTKAEGVSNVGKGQNVNGEVVNELGKFDVGVRFGESGIATDDIQSTSFLLTTDDDVPLTLDMLDLTDIALRYTSVGEEGGAREDSLKIGGQTAGVARNDAFEVDENADASLDILANDTDGAGRTIVEVVDDDDTDSDVLTAVGAAFLVAVDGLELGTLTVSPDGVTSFIADGADVDSLAEGEQKVFDFLYTSADGTSTATAGVTVTVIGQNDRPEFSVAGGDSANAVLTETDAPLVRGGTLTLSDVDVSDSVSVAFLSVAESGMTSGAPSNAALAAMFTLPAAPVLDDGETTDRFEWGFDSGATTFDYLAHDEVLTLSYLISATDDSGAANDSATETATIEVAGTNDGPKITGGDDAAELDESGGTLTATGTLSLEDLDLSDEVQVTVTSFTAAGDLAREGAPSEAALAAMLTLPVGPVVDGAQTFADFDWTFDSGSETFGYLTEGELLVLSFVITADDGNGYVDVPGAANEPSTDARTVTITITGTNEPPVISVEAGDRASALLTENAAGVEDSATLTLTDPNRTDIVNVSVDSVDSVGAPVPAGLSFIDMLTLDPAGTVLDATETTDGFTWTFDSGSESFAFLGFGETLTLEYNLIAMDDSGAANAIAGHAVTIQIEGLNQAPDITVGTGDNEEATVSALGGAYAAGGSLSLADVDITDRVTAVVTGVDALDSTRAYNELALLNLFTLDAFEVLDAASDSGSFDWSFAATTGQFGFLAGGEEVTFEYTIRATDDSGAPNDNDEHVVSITVVGAFTPPDITVQPGDSAGEVAERFEVVEDVATPAGIVGGVQQFVLVPTVTDVRTQASGDLTLEDTDPGDVVSVAVTGVTATGEVDLLDDATLLSFFALGGQPVLDDTEFLDSFGWTFDAALTTFDYLDDGEELVLTYTLEATDSHGLTDTQNVSVTIIGNDPPELLNDAEQTLTEGNDPLATSGDFQVSDRDGVASVNFNIQSKQFTDNASGAILQDAAAPNFIEIARMMSLQPVSVGSDPTGGTLTWEFNSGTETFDFLRLGDRLTLVFTVTAQDIRGATTERDVTIIVDGTNDAPDIFAAPRDDVDAAFFRQDIDLGTLSADGTLSLFDPDDLVDLSVVAAQNSHTASGFSEELVLTEAQINAAFSIASTPMTGIDASTGEAGDEPHVFDWSFAPDADFVAAVRDARATETAELKIDYVIRAVDQQGAEDFQTVSILISGSLNSAPRLSLVTGHRFRIDEDQGKPVHGFEGPADYALERSGTLRLEDRDLDDLTVTVDYLGPERRDMPDASVLEGYLTLDVAGFADGVGSFAGGVALHEAGWNFSAMASAFSFLKPDEIVPLLYRLTVDDGATSTQEFILFEVMNRNDRPSITKVDDEPQVINVLAGDPIDLSGTRRVFDRDPTDSVNVSVVRKPSHFDDFGGQQLIPLDDLNFTVTTEHGGTLAHVPGQTSSTLTWNFQTDFDFGFLSKGQRHSEVYQIFVDDGEGLTTFSPVQISIIGTDDPTEFGPDAVRALDETDAPLADSFTTTLSDADLFERLDVAIGGVTVTGALDNAAGDRIAPSDREFLAMLSLADGNERFRGGPDATELNWTFASGRYDFDFLRAGETIVVEYAVNAEDPGRIVPRFDLGGGLGSEIQDTQTITINIAGKNDQPVADDILLQQAVQPTATTLTGAFSGRDEDDGDTLSYELLNGGLATDETGATYQVAVNPDGQSWSLVTSGDLLTLNEGQVRTLTFQYQAVDDSGAGVGSGGNESDTSAPATGTIQVWGAYQNPDEIQRSLLFQTEGQSQFYNGEPVGTIGNEPLLERYDLPFIGIQDQSVGLSESFGGQTFGNDTLTDIIEGISSVVSALANLGCEAITLGFGDCDVEISIPSSVTVPEIAIDAGVDATIGLQPFFQLGSGELGGTVPVDLTFLTPDSVTVGESFVIETAYSLGADSNFVAGPAQIQFGLDLLFDIDAFAEINISGGKIGDFSLGNSSITLFDQNFQLGGANGLNLLTVGPDVDAPLSSDLVNFPNGDEDFLNAVLAQFNPSLVLDLPKDDLTGTGLESEGYAILEGRSGFEAEAGEGGYSGPIGPFLPTPFPGSNVTVDLENPDKREVDFLSLITDIDGLVSSYTGVPTLEFGYTIPTISFDVLPGESGGNTTLIKGGISFELLDVDLKAGLSLLQDFRMDIADLPLTVTFENGPTKHVRLGDAIIVEADEITGDPGAELSYDVDIDMDAVFESMADFGFDLQLFVGLLKAQVNLQSDYIPDVSLDVFPTAGKFDSDGNLFPSSDGYALSWLFELIDADNLDQLYANEFAVEGWQEATGADTFSDTLLIA